MNFDIQKRIDVLTDWFQSYQSSVVAFSGGVDSTVLAKAAFLTHQMNATAIFLESATSPSDERAYAERIAAEIGISLITAASHEFDDPCFVRNDPDRCYYCKKIRFLQLVDWAEAHHVDLLAEGSNADDTADYRPGSRAARELQVRAPLAELGITKNEIRAIAKYWQLSNWDKPATPCLATRLAYHLEITPERIRQVEYAERLLKQLGFTSVRVRLHEGNLARIEVAVDQISRFLEPQLRESVFNSLLALGFQQITLDLAGFRSGSMNAFVSR